MWKIAVAFIAFSLVALFFLLKAGDKVDMQGETHGAPTSSHESPASAPAPAAAPAAPAAASAASSAAPAASK